MIPSARTRMWLTKAARQQRYAALFAALLVAMAIKVFWFSAAEDAWLASPLIGLAWPILAFIAAVIGLRQFTPGPGPYGGKREAGDD